MHVLKPKLLPDSEEYVLEQLSVAEQKLVGVAEELASRDQDTIRKEMEDEEVRREGEGRGGREGEEKESEISWEHKSCCGVCYLSVPSHCGGRRGW